MEHKQQIHGMLLMVDLVEAAVLYLAVLQGQPQVLEPLDKVMLVDSELMLQIHHQAVVAEEQVLLEQMQHYQAQLEQELEELEPVPILLGYQLLD
jgi:hypothetical protein